MKKKKIAIIASSRATYGYKRKLIGLIKDSKKLELQLVVTGMHLMPRYGHSIRDIKADKYPIAAEVDIELKGDSPFNWTQSMGVEIQKLAGVFNRLKPDIVLITGDRAEMFAASLTAVYMGIAVAHIQAGDVSGHIDGSARHAITKLSHIHLASCEDSANRVRLMGEEPKRVFNVGAPQLDEIILAKEIPDSVLERKFNINLKEPLTVVIQHPVLVEVEQAYSQMKETMKALSALKMQSVIIYPNIDAGGKKIIKAIKEYEKLSFIKTFDNINRQHFINLLRRASVLVGNSSCSILEAASFKLPAVNIGNRQRGRMQAENIINCKHKTFQIKKAINKALYNKDFRKKVKECSNPYGDGKSSQRIAKILEDTVVDESLLDKRITY
jgi:GDP/UDP-N,N'-diacetylbacillosamine 2-epimerase (hydrolysing)